MMLENDSTKAERLQELFLAALEIADPQEQANFLCGECGDDSELLRDVQSLVAADRVEDGFLQRPLRPESTPQVLAALRDLPLNGQERSATRSQGSLPQIPGYEVLRELGRGGMGVVFLARDVALKRLVALKMVLAGGHASQDLVARFRVEAEAAARLQHPNIVQIHEIGDQGGVTFLTLEFMEGGSLDRQLGGKPQDPSAAAELVRTLARTIHKAHEANVIHRDLKPSNVLLTRDGIPKIADFGLAKQLDASASATQSGIIMGTPSYMAPEQATGKNRTVGPATDIYALGAILYEMLTGRPPFAAEWPLNTVKQLIEVEPVSVSRLRPNVPRDLETICLKCLQKEPKKRYATGADMAEDLGRFLRGEPIRARPVGMAERTWRLCRRNPLAASLVVAVAISLIVGTSVSLLYALRANEQATLVEAKGEEAKQHAKLAKMTAIQLQFDDAVRRPESNRAFSLLTAAELLCDPITQENRPLEQSLRMHLGSWFQDTHRLTHILPHAAGVRSVAFSPDGKIVLTGSGDRMVRLWEAATGRLLGKPLEHEANVWAVAFSPDGKTILVGCEDKLAWLWDVATSRRRPKPLRHQGAVSSVAFNPDGKTMLTGSDDKTAQLWQADTGEPLGTLTHDYPHISVAYSPDGKTVLTGGVDKTAQLWDASTRKPLGRLKHKDGVRAAVFSPDGKTVLTGGEDDAARLWDVATCEQLGPPLPHQNWVQAVAFSPDGKMMLTGSGDRTARLWDVATGKPIGAPLKQPSQVWAVAFGPDGKRVLTGGESKTVRLWQLATARLIGSPLGHENQINGIAFSPDGETVVTAGEDQSAQLRDVATGKLLVPPMRHRAKVERVNFSPDGKTVITRCKDNTAWLWDSVTGKPRGKTLSHASRIFTVAFSPDSKIVVTGSDDKTARLWNAATGEPLGKPMLHSGSVWAVAFSPMDGKTVLTGSIAHFAQLWDASTGQALDLPLMQHGDNGYVVAVAYSPDGKKLLTGSWDETAQLWDASTCKPLGKPMRHEAFVASVAFSPDGNRVLTGSWDTTARLWDADTGNSCGPPMEHPAKVEGACFSPDGRTVLTRCTDNTAWLWDAATSKPLGVPLRHQDCLLAGAFSLDGRFVFTGGSDKVIRRWHVPTPIEGDPERIRLWAQVILGSELDHQGGTRVMDAAGWKQRRQSLENLGGPPLKDRSSTPNARSCEDSWD